MTKSVSPPCGHCGGPIARATTGRPATYCSDTCRKAAGRARAKPVAPVLTVVVDRDAGPIDHRAELRATLARLDGLLAVVAPDKAAPLAKVYMDGLRELAALDADAAAAEVEAGDKEKDDERRAARRLDLSAI